MKRRLAILGALLAVLLVLFWGLRHHPREQPGEQPQPSEQAAAPTSAEPAPRLPKQPPGASKAEWPPTNGTDIAAFIERCQEEIRAAAEKGLDEWRTAIEFYGKVVDQAEHPVSGAQVDFSCNDLSEEGTSNYHGTSGGQGLFSITGITGKLLTVTVAKEGYYTSKRQTSSFYYAGQNANFVPDARNPVLFHLRAKGVAEPLIHYRRSFRVPRDGTPVEIDLATGTQGRRGTGGLAVECWTQDQDKRPDGKYDWKCRVSLVGGGIQPCIEEFPFSAPETAYASSDEIDMTVKPDQPWLSDVERRYFIQTADGRFGRVIFGMVAGGDHFCLIETYFNPSGSRNLEFDPNNVASGGN